MILRDIPLIPKLNLVHRLWLRWTSQQKRAVRPPTYPDRIPLLTKRLRFLIASALSTVLIRRSLVAWLRGNFDAMTSWLRGDFDAMTTEPDEDLHKPDRLECEPSRVCGASANANQDNTVLEEISNIIKVHRQAFTQTKRSLPQFDGCLAQLIRSAALNSLCI